MNRKLEFRFRKKDICELKTIILIKDRTKKYFYAVKLQEWSFCNFRLILDYKNLDLYNVYQTLEENHSLS